MSTDEKTIESVAVLKIHDALLATSGFDAAVLTLINRALIPREMQTDLANLATFLLLCQSWGVDPRAGGVYAVPIRGKVVPVLHYATMRGIAERHDPTAEIRGDAVYQGEALSYDPMASDFALKHEIKPDVRHGVPVGAWARVLRGDGRIYFSYVAFDDVVQRNSDAWKNWPVDMVKKCALRRALRDAYSIFAGVLVHEEIADARDEFRRDALPRVDANEIVGDLFGGAK